MLIQNGANINDIDNFGMTPLHYAASEGNLAICEKVKIPFSGVDRIP